MVGEFGGNDYNAPLFAGMGIPEAYKFMPDVIQGISDGIEVGVSPPPLCCVLYKGSRHGMCFQLQMFVHGAGTDC